MGIFNRALERLATQIVKAAPMSGYGNSVPLERPADIQSIPFAPGMPLIPSSINQLGERGRPDPRRWEYEVAQNINVASGRLVPFKTLRQAADQIDIIRRCLEVMKSKVLGLDWDIVLGQDAVEQVIAEQGVSQIRATAIAKEKYQTEINRARTFWETPDPANGLIFVDWLNMALEEILVLDALAVWPQKTVGGDLKGLQILDGSTIKPIIDDRGMRPEAPFTAFQQILYGFPRTEFSAPTETLETDGEFTSDEMAYFVKNRRTHSVYGYGPVERSLPLADLYLRRQQWLRAEYTDGVLPEIMFKTDGVMTPENLRAWENIFNDDLAGQTEQRKRGRVIPNGFDPVQLQGYDERFKDTFDEYLITSICGHWGILPTEIGFMGKGGLGGSSVHEGQANSSEVIGLIPLSQWLGRQLSQLSYVFLGMPRELEFSFQPSDRHDDEAAARADDIRIANGSLSRNEARAKAGLPLLEAQLADASIINTPAGLFALTADGVIPLTSPDAPTLAPTPEQVVSLETDNAIALPPVEEPKTKSSKPADVAEMITFMKWLRKSPSKPFKFDSVPEAYAETLNKFIGVGDHDGARWYAERYLA
jgi:hypothetical protein